MGECIYLCDCVLMVDVKMEKSSAKVGWEAGHGIELRAAGQRKYTHARADKCVKKRF